MNKRFLLILFSLLLINCSDNEDSVEQYTVNENLNVYALGFADGSGVQWYKGVPTFFPENSSVSSGIRIGSDIYLVGTINRNAAYWKNGVPTTLSNPSGSTPSNGYKSWAGSIHILNNNIYIVGSAFFGPNTAKPVLWTNNNPTLISNNEGSASSVFKSGSNIYIAGYEEVPNTNYQKKAILWVNGTPTTLTTNGFAESVFVSGSNVYVAYLDNINGAKGKIWKNGVSTSLTIPNGYYDTGISQVFVSGSDVYVSGDASKYNVWASNAPVFWKNNVPTVLSNSGVAHSIFVTGNDVYVSGHENIVGNSIPKIWKNSFGYSLPIGSRASSQASFVFN
jgi:hypothetical protein